MSKRLIIVSRRELAEEEGPGVTGVVFLDEFGEPVAKVARGASTKTKMHELAHLVLGHAQDSIEDETYDRAIQREHEADRWVYERLGRPMSDTEILQDYGEFIEGMAREGASASAMFNWVIDSLRENGFDDVAERNRPEIWRRAKASARRQ